MPARKKTKKKPAAKSAKKVNKAAARKAKARVKAPARKKPAPKKAPAKKAARKKTALAPGSLLISVEPALLERLQHLAGGMFKTVEQIIPQALGEFADHWEDHARTVEILNSGSDRVALVVPQDEEKTD